MEEYIIVLFDRLQNMIAERITASDQVAYAAIWDSLTTSMVLILQSMKYLSLESIASSSQRQGHLEAKLASVNAN